MARGRHHARGPLRRARAAEPTPVDAGPVEAVPVAQAVPVEPVRGPGAAIYDPSVPPGPAAVPRRGGARRVRRTRALGMGRSLRLTLVEPRRRAVTVGAMAVVATVGVTGLVLTSSAAPAPRHVAAPLPTTSAPSRTAAPASSTAPTTAASTAAPVPLVGPAAPPTARPTSAPVRAVAVSALTSDGIPSTALAAYRAAAARELTRDPGCGITWPLLAGIGRVESDHGRTGGAVLHTDGSATPRILGARLDGHGTAVIRDTDHGRLDGDRVYDRAVGPMQFIPSTWAAWGVDANHDGVRDPNNILDAAAAAADYLCAAGRDLRTYAGVVRAIRSYNNSQAYIALVIETARAYAVGTPVVVPTAPPGAPPNTGKPALPPADPGPPKGLQPRPKPKPSTATSTRPSSPARSTAPHPAPSSGGVGGSSAPGGVSSEPSVSPTPPVPPAPSTSSSTVTDRGTQNPTDAATSP